MLCLPVNRSLIAARFHHQLSEPKGNPERDDNLRALLKIGILLCNIARVICMLWSITSRKIYKLQTPNVFFEKANQIQSMPTFRKWYFASLYQLNSAGQYILFIIHNISTRCDGNHFSETDFLYYSEKWRAQQIPSNKNWILTKSSHTGKSFITDG